MLDIILIVVFNLALYLRTLTFDLVMDDQQWYEKMAKNGFDKKLGPLAHMAQRFYSGGSFGFNKTIDHLVTTIMWTSLCVISYFAFGHNKIAFVAALLLSAHPLMNQLSIWLNGRRYLVCAMLLMAALSVYPTNLWPAGFIFYLMSGLYHVTIFFLPVLFIMKVKYAFLLLAIIPVMIFCKMSWIKSKFQSRMALIPCEELRNWQPRRPIVVVKIFGFYFWKMIFPGRIQMIYPFIQMYGRTKEGNENAYSINFDFIKGVCAICVVGGIFFYSPADYKPWVAFMFLSLIQWCGILPITQMVSDRYASISTIFMCFFISYFSITLLPTSISLMVLTFFLTQYVLSTINVLGMYKDINAWYDYHTRYDAGNLAVTNLRIGMFLSHQRLFQASALLEQALAFHPNDYALNYLGYISAMIFQNMPLAKMYLEKCKNSIYLGEEKERTIEISDAELGLKAMTGEMNLKQPQRYPKKG